MRQGNPSGKNEVRGIYLFVSRENESTKLQIFPGVIPRTSVKKGRGRKGRLRRGKERGEVASWLSGTDAPQHLGLVPKRTHTVVRLRAEHWTY